jgi:riboflavin biosynthesis pyrimidine reductase
MGNFATTLDGVVSLHAHGASSGSEITGFDPYDRFVMGLLRAVADVVIVGAGTLRAVPRHTWTADHVYPAAAREYAALRRSLKKPPVPLNVIVTATGRVDLRLPLFARGEVPVLIVTNELGARRLVRARRVPSVDVVAVRHSGGIGAAQVLDAVRARRRSDVVLIEGGPHLMGTFFEDRQLEALFLTLAPQVAGRDRMNRPGLVAGRTFAPEHPLWGELEGVRRGGELLFLRFGFPIGSSPRRSRESSRSGRPGRGEP